MKEFAGFPASTRMRYTPMPSLFFTEVLPQIDDLAELRTILHFFDLLARKRGFPRYITFTELRAERALIAGLGSGDPEPSLRGALARATARGVLLQLAVEAAGHDEDVFFVNGEKERALVEQVQRGEQVLPNFTVRALPPAPAARPNIYELYEQNIGLLTPLLADELREAERTFPPGWIEEAFREAVGLNKRSWRYISRILERWAAEGKDHGEHRGHPGEDGPPDKYVRGKYGHLVRH